jgi:hypothetical protein
MVDLAGVAPRTTDFGFLPIPPPCRYNPDKPFAFNYWKTAVFALASTFSAFSRKNIPHLSYTSSFAGGKLLHWFTQNFAHSSESKL